MANILQGIWICNFLLFLIKIVLCRFKFHLNFTFLIANNMDLYTKTLLSGTTMNLLNTVGTPEVLYEIGPLITTNVFGDYKVRW